MKAAEAQEAAEEEARQAKVRAYEAQLTDESVPVTRRGSQSGGPPKGVDPVLIARVRLARQRAKAQERYQRSEQRRAADHRPGR